MRKSIFASMLHFSMCILLSESLFAAQTVTVVIEPACTNPAPLTGPSPVNLETSGGGALICGPFKIEPKSSTSGKARVEVGSDVDDDLLQLLNTKITKTVASVTQELHITFSANNFNETGSPALPDDVPANSGHWMNYYISQGGAIFKRGTLGTATGDRVRFNGYTQLPPSFPQGDNNAWDPLVSANCPTGALQSQYCYTVGTNTVPAFTKEKIYNEMSHPRALKGEMWVLLADPSGATLDSFSLTTFPIQNGGGGGGKGGGKGKSSMVQPRDKNVMKQ